MILSIIKRYKLTDASLFEIILSDCEVLKPLQIDTQISAKVAGSEWEEKINSFPKSFVRKLKFMRLLPSHVYLSLTAKLTGYK